MNPPTISQTALTVPGQDSEAPEAILEGSSALLPGHKELEIGSNSISNLQSVNLEVERVLLRQKVYDDVQRENAALISGYDTILSSASNGPILVEAMTSLPDKLEVIQHS